MTPRPRITSPIQPAAHVVDQRRAEHDRDRALFEGARRQREIRESQAARRDDDDGNAA
jgi:hypothetical protein